MNQQCPALGGPQRYSDLAITTVLVVKHVFRLTLRAAQGFIDSIFALMDAHCAVRIKQESASGQSRLTSVLKRPPGMRVCIW